MAANKCDLIDIERVSEERARNFAKEIGAIFKLTSASSSIGIEELFVGVGRKFLDSNYKKDENKKNNAQVISEPIVEKKQEKEPELINQNSQNNQINDNNKFVVIEKKENTGGNTIKLDQNADINKKKKKFC